MSQNFTLRILSAIILPALLFGCGHDTGVSSKAPVSDEDYSKMENDRLCEFSFTRVDPRIDAEIKRRKLYCDQSDFLCRKQGFQRNSLAMIDCVYKDKLKYQSPDVKYCFNSGIGKGDIKGMTGCLIERQQIHSRI